MALAMRALGAVVGWNNHSVTQHADDRRQPNPRPITGVPWHEALAAAHPAIRGEWDEFVARGDRLPRIEDVLGEHQGNEGAWRAGLLVSEGRPVGLAPHFPKTTAALAGVPGLWSALWSVLDPGTDLPEHRGPNAGVLRYHLGVRCGADSDLRIGDTVTPYRDGLGILFDDTAPHAATNRGGTSRTTLFLEILRPCRGRAGIANRAVQRLVALDPRYRAAAGRALEWDQALNVRR